MTRRLQFKAPPPAVLAYPAMHEAEIAVLQAITRLGETMATV